MGAESLDCHTKCSEVCTCSHKEEKNYSRFHWKYQTPPILKTQKWLSRINRKKRPSNNKGSLRRATESSCVHGRTKRKVVAGFLSGAGQPEDSGGAGPECSGACWGLHFVKWPVTKVKKSKRVCCHQTTKEILKTEEGGNADLQRHQEPLSCHC